MIFRYSCSICSRYLRFDGNAWNISGENSIFSLPAFRRGLCCTIIGCLTSRVVFLQRLFSIKGCIPSKVVFLQRSSSIKGCLPSKVVFHQRSYSIKGRLPSKVIFYCCIKCVLEGSSMFPYHPLFSRPLQKLTVTEGQN